VAQSKPCSPTCQSFKCTKSAAIYRRDSVWCREAEEQCNIAKCTYSMCFKRRMLPGAICGETVRRQTVEHDIIEDDYRESNNNASVKLKGKALRKLGDQDYY